MNVACRRGRRNSSFIILFFINVPGFFIAQLCRISTLPSEISDHPIQSGGRTVFLITGFSDWVSDCVAALTEASG